MSAPAFSFTSPTPITSQPNSAGEKVVVRSDNAADTGNYTHVGLVGGTSTAETNALTGKREVLSTAIFTTFSSGKLSAAQAGTVSVYGSGVAAVGTIIFTTQPANNDTILIGLTGFEQTYTFKTTLTGAANEILRGADATASALNLKKAINDEGTAGTHYGTGTVANAYASAAVSGTIVTLTDRIPVLRSLAWVVSQSVGATLSISAPSGGALGTLLATLTAGNTHTYDNFTLSSEDLATNTVPGLFTGTSDWIQIGGGPFSLRFKGAGITTGIAMTYQTSTDATNAATGLASISNVTNSHTVAAPQVVVPDELNAEYVRLTIGANANTADTKVDGRPIYR